MEIEKFCPVCGHQDTNGQLARNIIAGNDVDVFGAGFLESGGIINKKIKYILGETATINLDIFGDTFNDFEVNLQKIINEPKQVEFLLDNSTKLDKDFKKKIEESSTLYQEIKNILDEITKKIEKKHGINIREIKAGKLKISKNELLLIELILNGNEHFYKKEYNESIERYNKALELDSNNFYLFYNTACAFCEMGKYRESIEQYDKALKINPDYADALYNKRIAIYELEKSKYIKSSF